MKILKHFFGNILSTSILTLVLCISLQAQNKATQTLTFDEIPDKTCKDSIITLNASSSSGLPVSFKVLGGKASISGSSLTLLGIGIVSILAYQNGNNEYEAATSIINHFNVAIASKSKIYVNLNRSFCEQDTIKVSVKSIAGIHNIWTSPKNDIFEGLELIIPDADTSMSGEYYVQYFENKCAIFEGKGIDFDVEIKQLPHVVFENVTEEVLSSKPPFELKARPSGGVFSINKKISSTLNASVLGIGQAIVSYSVTGTNGCKSAINKTITITNDFGSLPYLKVYELITPNGDGNNDVLWIDNISLFEKNEVFVYNQWGSVIFTANNYKNDWSPTNVPDGSYYYVVKLKQLDNTYQGGLLIVR